ncbi:MAG: lipoprotein-releasing ABC transporter permease subunit [Alphaproteobacteria bacterium]|nr:MAG: lipoprotein-releasing ABC transporter permease subunit [Alphaproteobacteria bacterium]
MQLEFFLARKLSRRKEGFASLITKLAFSGIFLGVTALIIVMSVMNGFKEELMRQLIGMKGHVVVFKHGGVDQYEDILEQLTRNKNVTLALPVIEEPTLLIKNDQFHGVMLYGHDPESLRKHAYFKDNIKQGSIADLQDDNTVMIGSRLAEQYNLTVGDTLTLLNPQGEETIFGITPKERDFKIVGIFELGMREYDRRFIFTSLATMQQFFYQPDMVHHIDVFTKTGDATGVHMERPYHVLDWQHTDSTLFKALLVQKNVMFIILALMIVIAVLNIVSSLTMFVKDKTKEIAILRSMGMQRSGVRNIFLLSGSMIGVSGTFLGACVGVFVSQYINQITQFIERVFHVKIFNPELYFLSQLPSVVAYQDIFYVCLMSLGFTFLATLYPSVKASKLEPAPVLR